MNDAFDVLIYSRLCSTLWQQVDVGVQLIWCSLDVLQNSKFERLPSLLNYLNMEIPLTEDFEKSPGGHDCNLKRDKALVI